MIEAKDISFGYGRRKVLSGVSAKFEDGVFAAVLGANGAGKSTLLKILSGWLKPDGGEVLYAGANAASLGARELAKSRAVLEQECRLDFACPVGQIVRMSGFSAGALGAEAKTEEAKAALDAAGLSGFSDRIYTELSGGEKRRVHLARALCQLGENPEGKALLLDEPAASLDPAAAHAAMRAAKSAAQKGACVVAVLHDPNLAFDYCDFALLLKGGKIAACGNTPETLTRENLSFAYSHPCGVFPSPFGETARFPKSGGDSNS